MANRTCYGGFGAAMMEGFGPRLRSLRERRGYSQADLAERAEMTQAAVSHLESGRRTPMMRTLYRLARALEVPVGDLLDWTGWGVER
jgi:transcriptional regulator with XRE-family HTH domain